MTAASFPISDCGTGPWDLPDLEQPPAVWIENVRRARGGNRRIALSEVYYAGEPWLGRETRVFAHYACPDESSARPVPTVVLIHGGGGTASREWAREWAYRGYAALSMDLYGQGPGGQRLPDGGADWSDFDVAFRLTAGVRNGWIYQAVANVIRGVSALRTMPEVDPARVGVSGVSWGGTLTCFVMSLDRRVRFAVPIYGFGFNPTLGMPADPSDAERDLIRQHFEPGLYLPRCTAPVLWVNGTNERYATMDRLQSSYRAASGPRTLSVTVRPAHTDPQLADAGWERPEGFLFADAICHGSDPLAAITGTEIAGAELRVRYESAVSLDHAAIHWTAETETGDRRRWRSAFGTVHEPGFASAPIPAVRPVVVFVTLMDRRGAVVSTEHVFLE